MCIYLFIVFNVERIDAVLYVLYHFSISQWLFFLYLKHCATKNNNEGKLLNCAETNFPCRI